MKNIVIFGSTGAIGGALIEQLAQNYPDAIVHGVSRSHATFSAPNVRTYQIDYQDESQLQTLSKEIIENGLLDLVVTATGTLHGDGIKPEKSMSQMSAKNFQQLFAVNTILPALVAKHFLPYLNKTVPSIFASLSARVGSISDNQLGGWYAYRASKSALNMIIKNCAIEIGRRNRNAIVIGLHPGTVDSDLSKPFQGNVPEAKLFTPEYSAEQLIAVMSGLTHDDSGKCFAWDGVEIIP